MTNKVKPFYIRITDDMTPQMVQDALDKCVDAGAIAFECVVNTSAKYAYKCDVDLQFGFFGVDYEVKTYLQNSLEYYGATAQEITLDQLDEWLGLKVEEEWENGDECVIRGEKLIYIGESIEADIHCVQELGTCLYRNAHISVIEKPETPEQKAERERLEAAYDLYNHVQSVRGQLSCKFDWFSNPEMEETRLRFLAIVDKTNYRKQ